MDRDDIHAFNEQWKDVESRYNPEVVHLKKVKPNAGTLARIEFEMDLAGAMHPRRVFPSKFYVHKANEETLSRTDHIAGVADILPGFPASRPKVKFLNNQIPQHINIFRNGAMCIGTSDETVLSIMFDNIFRACIYDPDPSVANYGSAADGTARDWQKEREASGEFPILNPALLFQRARTGLPPVKRAENLRKNTGLAPIRR